MTEAILFTPKSANAKTGPIPVTTTDRNSCPSDCIFLGDGCYADNGPLGSIWTNITEAGPDATFRNGRNTIPTIGWNALCEKIAELEDETLWRHNQAGDLPKIAGTAKIDGDKVRKLTQANAGKRGFTYTHHNVVQDADNRAVVAEANQNGFVINLSGNNTKHADMLADLGIGPVVCVLPIDQNENTVTPKGRKVVVCPATVRDNVSCMTCQLCQRGDRKTIVGFPAHGVSKKRASVKAMS